MFWENYSLYFRAVWSVVVIIFFFGLYFGKFQVQAADIEDLKSRMSKQEIASAQILQSVQDIKDYFNIGPRR